MAEVLQKGWVWGLPQGEFLGSAAVEGSWHCQAPHCCWGLVIKQPWVRSPVALLLLPVWQEGPQRQVWVGEDLYYKRNRCWVSGALIFCNCPAFGVAVATPWVPFPSHGLPCFFFFFFYLCQAPCLGRQTLPVLLSWLSWFPVHKHKINEFFSFHFSVS